MRDFCVQWAECNLFVMFIDKKEQDSALLLPDIETKFFHYEWRTAKLLPRPSRWSGISDVRDNRRSVLRVHDQNLAIFVPISQRLKIGFPLRKVHGLHGDIIFFPLDIFVSERFLTRCKIPPRALSWRLSL